MAHELRILNQSGVLLKPGITDFIELSYTLSFNDIHSGTIILEDTFPQSLLQQDYRLEIIRDGVLMGQSQFLIQGFDIVINSDGTEWFQVNALGANQILQFPIVAYNAGTSQASKTDFSDDMMKEIVSENLGTGATDTDRDSSTFLDIEANTGAGPSITKGFSRRKVLRVLQDLANASATAGTRVFFDIILNTSNKLEFRTFTGQRRSNRVDRTVFSPSRDNLKDIRLSFNWREMANFVYGGGQGQESNREIQTASDSSRIAGSVWGRNKEFFRNASNVSSAAGVADEADAALRARREIVKVSAKPVSTTGTLFGRDWNWGDLVSVEVRGYSFTASINPVTITVKGKAEDVQAQFRFEA